MQNVASFLSFFGGFLNAYSESLFRNEVKGVFFMENNKKIKPNSYYSIQYWMINELGLKGLELSIYAIIYGFSRDHCGAFTGSRSYLADFTNSTKAGVDKALKKFNTKEFVREERLCKSWY